MQFGFFDESKRKTIKTSVKREVYKRAKGSCERCGKKLPFTGGATCYHHRRTPTISPTAKTVQLLCQNCHAEHGHKHRTVTRSGFLYEEKEKVIKRQRVKKKRMPTKKKSKTKKKTTKKTTMKKKLQKERPPLARNVQQRKKQKLEERGQPKEKQGKRKNKHH